MVQLYRYPASCALTKVHEIGHMLKAIHARESRDAVQAKARSAVVGLRRQKLGEIEAHIDDMPCYYSFSDSHRPKIRTKAPLERIMPETHRCIRVEGAFPDRESCVDLAAASRLNTMALS